MILYLLLFFLFAVVFSAVQGLVLQRRGKDRGTYIKTELSRIKNRKAVRKWLLEKELKLKKKGADIFIKDGLTLSQWYLYKALMAGTAAVLTWMISHTILRSVYAPFLTAGLTALAWFFLDLMLYFSNRASNDEMMADVCEMSRSVLYGKRGGEYIIDCLYDAVTVVENKRLKTGLIKLSGNLSAGRPLDESLTEFESSFDNAEISSFCTIIKSLQSTGQVDEALKTLENMIVRSQAGVNKRKCIVLENKTMYYVLLLAFDLLIMILYCIIMKLLDMQIAF